MSSRQTHTPQLICDAKAKNYFFFFAFFFFAFFAIVEFPLLKDQKLSKSRFAQKPTMRP